MADIRVETLDAPFDRQSMLERVDGDEEVMGMVLGVFIEDAPLTMQTLRQAVEQGDAAQIRLTAHALKGAAANISAEELRSGAHDLEMLGVANDLAAVPGVFQRVETAMSRLMPVLEQMVSGQ
jgi:HPt (histidine-containing phosphotransfer) domain-containing protein